MLEKLAEERRPSYAEAHIHVKSGDGAHKDVVDAIVAALERLSRRCGLSRLGAVLVGQRALRAE